MTSGELHWGSPGPCPSCGAITDHIWYTKISGVFWHPGAHEYIDSYIQSDHGKPLLSMCTSESCQALALWIESEDEWSGAEEVKKLYPQPRTRIPPADGLDPEEVKLYEEASDVAGRSPRAACALLRVLLEMLLKRYLVAESHLTDAAQRIPLVKLIEMAVEHLDLTRTLESGLEAGRERGNTATHDPYGLTDEARAEDLPWLFQAVDDLVDDLHVKPQKWAGMAESAPDEHV